MVGGLVKLKTQVQLSQPPAGSLQLSLRGLNSTDTTTTDENHNVFISFSKKLCIEWEKGRQSSTHVSATKCSNDDDFESFFDDVEPNLAQYYLHPATASTLTDQEPFPVSPPKINYFVENQDFGEVLRL